MKAEPHPQQAERLAALRRYDILDTPREEDFDEIVALASRICETPIALVSLVDEDRQWFKAETGLGVDETPLDQSMCAHAILKEDVMVVPDTTEDPRTRDNPLVTADRSMRFYAGAPLRTKDGQAIGTLCVLDDKPRELEPEQAQALEVLAKQVMAQLDLRRALKAEHEARRVAEETAERLATSLEEQKILAREVDHRVKNLFALVPALIALSARGTDDATRLADSISARIGALARAHTLTLNAFSEDRGIALDALVHAVLEPYATRASAFLLDGPALRISGGAGSAMSLTLHELATNAAKYGALVERDGQVRITWRVMHGESRQDGADGAGTVADVDRLILRWSESGGPTVEGGPETSGFGTSLIDRLVQIQGGQIERDWAAKGLNATLMLPLSAGVSAGLR